MRARTAVAERCRSSSAATRATRCELLCAAASRRTRKEPRDSCADAIFCSSCARVSSSAEISPCRALIIDSCSALSAASRPNSAWEMLIRSRTLDISESSCRSMCPDVID